MTRDWKLFGRSLPWFSFGLVAVFGLSLALRFWGLSRFNSLVFDEVYYAKFAAAFLQGKQDFGGHPPLSTYLIATGIWLAQQLGWGDPTLTNTLTGLELTPFSYRWLNALTGSFIPLVVGAIAVVLTRRRTYGLLAALFAALDGMFLVESRYALNNIYLVLFGLLGHLFLLLALRTFDVQRRGKPSTWLWGYLLLSGIGFGASINIKWNGAGFLLGAGLAWAGAWVVKLVAALRARWAMAAELEPTEPVPVDTDGGDRSPIQHLTRLNPLHLLWGFVGVPTITYSLLWIPYAQLDLRTGFWQWQLKVLDYHQRVGGMEAHPYCSRWFTWPLMVRPVAYFYEATQPGEVGPVPGAATATTEVIYDVHAMGNPLLWWFSTAAMLVLIAMLITFVWHWLKARRADPEGVPGAIWLAGLPNAQSHLYTAAYLIASWAGNWLPWAKVTRCTFIYHYMGASVFALLGLALLGDRWLHSPLRWHRATGITLIFLIGLAFVFWLPLYLGLPISADAISLRRWFRSWI